MKRLLILTLFLLAQDASAAKLLSNKARQYFPVFGIGSTSSVVYTGAQGSVVAITNNAGSSTEMVRIFTTSTAYIDIGTDPLPTQSSMVLPANTEMIIEIPSGSRVGAIDKVSGAGALTVTRLLLYPNKD